MILTTNKEKKGMLISFKVENYKNFKEPIVLDFSDTHDYKFNNQCIKNGLLTKIVIYGANASGKSNFGFALFDIVYLLTDKNTNQNQHDELTFLNADSDKNVATFEYIFKNKKDIIKYTYKKKSPKELTYEELSINGEIVFIYDFINKKFIESNLRIVNAETINFEYFENNFAVLRHIANNTNQSENSHIKFIMNFVSHMLWFRSVQENGYIGYTTGNYSLGQWISNNNLVKEFQDFLKDLAGIEINLETAELTLPIQQKILVEKHKNKVFPFEQFSSSGCKALELLFFWCKHFNDVSFLFMDEFDAFYHFDLARNVIKYITDYDNIQVIFTTHNPNLASNELLRPDCYFTLNNGTLISFVSSTEREIREGHNLEKMLRNGEFNG